MATSRELKFINRAYSNKFFEGNTITFLKMKGSTQLLQGTKMIQSQNDLQILTGLDNIFLKMNEDRESIAEVVQAGSIPYLFELCSTRKIQKIQFRSSLCLRLIIQGSRKSWMAYLENQGGRKLLEMLDHKTRSLLFLLNIIEVIYVLMQLSEEALAIFISFKIVDRIIGLNVIGTEKERKDILLGRSRLLWQIWEGNPKLYVQDIFRFVRGIGQYFNFQNAQNLWIMQVIEKCVEVVAINCDNLDIKLLEGMMTHMIKMLELFLHRKPEYELKPILVRSFIKISRKILNYKDLEIGADKRVFYFFVIFKWMTHSVKEVRIAVQNVVLHVNDKQEIAKVSRFMDEIEKLLRMFVKGERIWSEKQLLKICQIFDVYRNIWCNFRENLHFSKILAGLTKMLDCILIVLQIVEGGVVAEKILKILTDFQAFVKEIEDITYWLSPDKVSRIRNLMFVEKVMDGLMVNLKKLSDDDKMGKVAEKCLKFFIDFQQ